MIPSLLGGEVKSKCPQCEIVYPSVRKKKRMFNGNCGIYCDICGTKLTLEPTTVIEIAEILKKVYKSSSEVRATGDFRFGDIAHNIADIRKGDFGLCVGGFLGR